MLEVRECLGCRFEEWLHGHCFSGHRLRFEVETEVSEEVHGGAGVVGEGLFQGCRRIFEGSTDGGA